MLVLNPQTFKSMIKPLLFAVPPETAQEVAAFAFKQQLLWRALAPALKVQNGRLDVSLAGMWLENPVGLAAGFDKNCEMLPSLAALGFGYVIGGTVTENPRPGNPSPRIVRYAENESLINSMGFPNKGLEHAVRQIQKAQGALGSTPVVVSVSGTMADEIVRCHRRLEPLVDAIEINISSPNTLGLRVFQEQQALLELLDQLNEDRRKLLFVKLPTYQSPEMVPSAGAEQRDRVLSLAQVCAQKGVDALTVANTWPARDSRLAVGQGGLSGWVVLPDILRMVREVRSEVGERMVINACGGIFSGEDAWKALDAGASTVQIYTALIYRGPGIVRQINKELLAIMDRAGVGTLTPAGVGA